MDMDLMQKRARVLAMQKDMEESQAEFQKILQELQGACHHESVIELDTDSRGKERRICVICGMEEKRCKEEKHLYGSKCEYAKLSFPFVVQKVCSDEFDRYRKLHKLVLVPVPAFEPKTAK